VRNEAGREIIARAHRHRDRLSPRERLFAEVEYQREVLRDPRAEREALDRLLAESPDDRDGLIRSVWTRLANGEVAAAREDLRALLAVDSTSALAVELTAVVAGAEGDYDAAERAIDRYAGFFPADSLYLLSMRGELAAARGDLDEGEAFYSRLRDQGRGTPWEARAIDWGLARFARLRGRLRRYVELQAEAARLTGVADAERRMGNLVLPVRVRAWFGAPFEPELDALRRALAGALADSLTDASPMLLDLSATLAMAGDAAGARRYVDRWLEEADSIDRAAQAVGLLNARGEIAIAERRGDAALEAFLAARTRPCASCRQVDIGRAHELAGRPDAARAAYSAFLDGRGFDRLFFDSNGLPVVLQRLAALEEAAGRTERARLLYARFIELWEDADPDLQPRVDAARRRLQTLVDREG
jgi:tetratricopeptide (TPR) repeat protein